MPDQLDDLQQRLLEQIALKKGIAISGGHSKDFYGRHIEGDDFSLANHTGVIEYEPRELVLTARSGTPLSEIQSVLSENHQMLSFEPPSFSSTATLGGTIACGFSGHRRPFSGSVRDLLLGVKLLNGHADVLNFGGQVMKNVAGYDVSRLMVGAMGTLGIILQASLKVLPKPESEVTMVLSQSEKEAIETMNALTMQKMPVSALAFVDGQLYCRVSGVDASVQKSVRQIGGDVLDDAASFWYQLNEQQHPFFNLDGEVVLWRLSVPPATPVMQLPGRFLYDWGGAQRWLVSDADPQDIRKMVIQRGGHAVQFRQGDRASSIFQPLSPALMTIHQQLKNTLDPHGVFNVGRLYQEF